MANSQGGEACRVRVSSGKTVAWDLLLPVCQYLCVSLDGGHRNLSPCKAGLAQEAKEEARTLKFSWWGDSSCTPLPPFFKVHKRVSRPCIPGVPSAERSRPRPSGGTPDPFLLLVAWLQDHLSRVPEEGAWLGRHRRGSREIVSAVGNTMSTFDHI